MVDMRLQSHSDDPLEEFPEWSEMLKRSVVRDLDPLVAAEAAQQAAQVAAAASLTLAAGASGAAISGGTTMTSATMSAATAANASILSTLGGKIGAAVLATAMVTGGAVITSTISTDGATDTAPITTNVDQALKVVETTSGSLSLDLDQDGLRIVDMVALPGWTATVTNQTASELSVMFSDDASTITVDAIVDRAGAIVTEITSQSSAAIDQAKDATPSLGSIAPEVNAPNTDGVADVQTDATLGAGATAETESGAAHGSAGADLSVDTSAGLNVN